MPSHFLFMTFFFQHNLLYFFFKYCVCIFFFLFFCSLFYFVLIFFVLFVVLFFILLFIFYRDFLSSSCGFFLIFFIDFFHSFPSPSHHTRIPMLGKVNPHTQHKGLLCHQYHLFNSTSSCKDDPRP